MSLKRLYMRVAAGAAAAMLLLTGCLGADENQKVRTSETAAESEYAEMDSDVPYVVLNDNEPSFSEDEITTKSFEEYSELDELDRCGAATACVGVDLMPTEERGSIGQVKPSGWHTVKYDNVDGKYLYNRCHLIGYQLSGENANERNLITGTRYMNTEGMLPFENEVAEYVRDTKNHVMYRVTPEFEEDNLLASGVHMEALSVEDHGAGVCFNVFVYNAQPGIAIDYATGESMEAGDAAQRAGDDGGQTVAGDAARGKGEGEGPLASGDELEEQKDTAGAQEQKDTAEAQEYVLNTNTKKFHLPSCGSVEDIKEKNKESFNGGRKWLIENGYEPCGRCKP